MGILNSFTNQLSNAMDSLREKNHRTAMVNRLRIVIKNERENSARAYVALGKYYYENLRDQGNAETESLCASIDESDRRMQRAFSRLEEIRESCDSSTQQTECNDCSDDCSACKYNDDEARPTPTTPPQTPKAEKPAPQEPQPQPPEPAVTPAEEEAAPEESEL